MPIPTVQHVPIRSVKPNPENPRTIRDERFRKLVQSIRDFPQMLELRPIVVNADRIVLGGNMRLRACKEAGLATVPIVIADNLTPEQQREFVVKDNVGFGDWDWDTLANEWDSAQLDAWGLEVPAVEQDKAVGLTEPDEAPEIPKEPTLKRGDLILLGNHRLICGDATDTTAWSRLLNSRTAQMVWTDPPYGVSYIGKTKDALTIQNDELDEAGLESLLRASFALAFAHCDDGAAWYVAAPAGPLHTIFALQLKDLGVWRQTIQWVKDIFVLGRSDYHYRNEPIFYGWKPGAAHYFIDDRTQDTVWEISRPKRSSDHPTMKPVELVQRAILNSSKPGDLIVEPFGGSGTTLIAAEATNRHCAAIELDPRYCDVIVKRWQNFTGRTATYADTGQPVPLD